MRIMIAIDDIFCDAGSNHTRVLSNTGTSSSSITRCSPAHSSQLIVIVLTTTMAAQTHTSCIKDNDCF